METQKNKNICYLIKQIPESLYKELKIYAATQNTTIKNVLLSAAKDLIDKAKISQ